MVGNTMFTVQIYNRLKDIKGSLLPFGGVSKVAIGDLNANIYETVDVKVKVSTKALNKQPIIRNERKLYKADLMIDNRTKLSKTRRMGRVD